MDLPVPPSKQLVYMCLTNGAWGHFEIVDDSVVELHVIEVDDDDTPGVRAGQSKTQL